MSSDDDESSYLSKLLIVPDNSLPSTDTTSTVNARLMFHNEDTRPVTQDKKSYDRGQSTQDPINNTDDYYSWLLSDRERKIGEEDGSSSSSSFDFLSTPLPKPPDGGWGWMVVLGASVVLAICEGLPNCFGLIYSDLLVHFGESRSKTSLVGSIFFGVSMILGPFASAMTIRFGCRTMTIVGGILTFLGFILCYFATSIEMLCVTFGVIAGTGCSFCLVTSGVVVHFYFDKRRSLATGLSVCGTGIGTFTFAPLIDYFLSEYGWRGSFLILSGVSLNIIVCGLLFRPLKCTGKQRLEHFCTDFDKLPNGKANLEMGRMRTISERTELTTDLDVLEDKSRTLSMPSLPTSACENATNDSSQIFIEALKKSLNPHLTSQRYMRNASFPAVTQGAHEIAHAQRCTQDETSNGFFEDTKRGKETATKSPSPKDVTNNVVKNSQKFKKCPQTLTSQSQPKSKRNEDLKTSTDLVDSSNDNISRMVSGLHRGRHHVMGIQLLLYRTDIFFRRQLDQTSDNNPRLLGTSCPELMKSNAQPQIRMNECRQSVKSFFMGTYYFLVNMTDISLFRNTFFAFFAVSNFIYYFWSDVPMMFITDHATLTGISGKDASFFISIIGVANTIGQVVFGIVGDMNINLIVLFTSVMCLGGIFLIIFPFLTVYWNMAVIYACFGFFISIWFTFETVLLVNYMGVGQLTYAYGMLLMMQGLANIVGPPFAGWISDMTDSYVTAFYLSGIACACSSLLMLFVLIPRCGVRRVNTTKTDQEEKH